jgi:OmpA-OmpF porin, OOP family
MDKRILALLIAAMTGTAYAQSGTPAGYLSNSSGTAVRSSAGDCVRTSASGNAAAICPPQQMAQSTPNPSRSASDRYRGDTRAATAPAAAAAGASTLSSASGPQREGYVVSNERTAVVDSSGHCVRTNSWTPDKAAEPCDALPRASTPPVPVAAAPAPEPTPAPLAQAAPETPAPPVLEKITLSTDVLFPFNKSELLPGGKEKLDDLAKSAQGAEVDKIVLAGYADRIGSEGYNRELSEKRAQAVADYIATKGVDQSRIQVEGRGEDQSVTGDQCKRMGPEKASNKKLVSCLQPDRRVEAELLGSREVAAGTSSPATGATSTGTGSSSGSGTSGR